MELSKTEKGVWEALALTKGDSLASSNKVYGPYFFEDVDTGNVRTVTTEAYIEMLNNAMNFDINPDIWIQ